MNFLDPRGYNRSQKVGLAAGLVLLVLLVAIHNPFMGYDTHPYMGYDVYKGWTDLFLWRSEGAMSVYLGTLAAFLGFIVLIVIFTAGWIWIFRSPANEADSSPTAKANEKQGEK